MSKKKLSSKDLTVSQSFTIKELVETDRLAESFVSDTASNLAAKFSADIIDSIKIEITVSVKPMSDTGTKKSKRELKNLVLFVAGTCLYMDMKQSVIFDFSRGSYMWCGKDIYLTEKESLYLANVLLTGGTLLPKDRGAKSSLIRKFGQDFLKGSL
jgi:hypothetical protein